MRTKIDDFFLTTHECDLDVIFLTETGLDDRIDSLQLFGTSYNVFRCDRNPRNSDKSSFGGVLIAVAQCYPSSIAESTYSAHLEQVCVNATVRGKQLLLCCLYIPPDKSSSIDIVDSHVSSICELWDKCTDRGSLLVCGDFNQPRIEWGSDGSQHVSIAHLPCASAALIDGMNFLNLTQVNTQRNHLGRMLDLVFCTSGCSLSIDRCVTPLLPVDPHHPPLVMSLPVCDNRTAPALIDETKQLNFRRMDFSALDQYLLSVDWRALLEFNDVDEMASKFCETISEWMNSNVPLAKRPASPAWGTPYLRQLKRERNRAQRAYRKRKTTLTQRNFKRSSAEYRRLNAVLYKSYVLRVQTDLRKQPKNFWNFVNSKRKCSSIPSHVCLDGIDATSVSESCELFANFFSSVFANETASDQDAQTAASYVPADLVNLNVFEITADMIITAAKN
ncbi:uncharacterized protein LOC128737794 [Sabethes cyaneus]|uniref:uncharacterized protein LOC128737794 n=1 Tax=Sabethes cyaneus TaxID=53552 RepID=UPI00237E7A15|nr:uncharacterized protein LOC128737794 [Sabethes cyaneus]